jgi:hypothetical protein
LSMFHPCHARFRVWLLNRLGTQGVWSCSFDKKGVEWLATRPVRWSCRYWGSRQGYFQMALARSSARPWGSSPTHIPFARRPASPSSTHHPVCNPCSREDDGREYGAGLKGADESGDRKIQKSCKGLKRLRKKIRFFVYPPSSSPPLPHDVPFATCLPAA